jgi:hypothetical protein
VLGLFTFPCQHKAEEGNAEDQKDDQARSNVELSVVRLDVNECPEEDTFRHMPDALLEPV